MEPFDPLLNTGLRLGVMSLLIKLKSASFVYLKKELNATQGNLSVQLEKHKQATTANDSSEFIERVRRDSD